MNKIIIVIVCLLSSVTAYAKNDAWNAMQYAAKKTGVPLKVLAGICYVESRHKVNVINHDDGGSASYGLCQIKMNTAVFMGFKEKSPIPGFSDSELMKPRINALYAAKYLKYQLKRYNNDIVKAIRAYNRGHYDGVNNSEYYTKVIVAMEKF